MKQCFLIAALFGMSFLSAVESNKILYYEVRPHDDLSLCERVYCDIMSQGSLDQENAKARFQQLKSLIGSGITFLCLIVENTLIGFLTLEQASPERLVLYDSPLAPEYQAEIDAQLGDILQEKFPDAKEIVVIAPVYALDVIELLNDSGFQPYYDVILNKNIISNAETFQPFIKRIK